MKYKRLAVFIENKRGSFYQVALQKEEMDMVADFISQIQDGTIKIRKERFYSLEFVKPANLKAKLLT